MTQTTTRDESELRQEAYLKAYRKTQDIDLHAELQGIPSRDEVEREAHQTFVHYQETARYCNNTAPYLRRLAGYGDRGYGTYQECPDREARELFGRLVDAYQDGYVDGMIGRGPEVSTDD